MFACTKLVLFIKQWNCSVNGGGGKKTSVQPFSSLFLKTLTERAVTTEAGSLFQYFTTLTENADPLLWWWLAPWRILKFYGRNLWKKCNTLGKELK